MAEEVEKFYIGGMNAFARKATPADLTAELERKYFWWEPVGSEARKPDRILAQAMEFAPFAEVIRLETILGRDALLETMLRAEPGWFSDRSWEFWRGRLAFATGRAIPEEPPRRAFHAGPA